MLNKKKIKLFFSSLLLLISLISVSGFTAVSTNQATVKTEIVRRSSSIANKSITLFKPLNKSVINSPFMMFNFKCFLNIHHLDFSLIFKSQNKTILQFLKHQISEQNLITLNKTRVHKTAS